jgi:glycosyltransferase involved in cell wall biosynthesis/SAM-dependent methyltransferase
MQAVSRLTGTSTGRDKRLLNLGCGETCHPDWLNVDFHCRAGIAGYDLRLGVPFADDVFDVVYHSHLLEHFSLAEGERFLKECFRVLRPGGLLRLAVPDLENIAEAYLAGLKEVRAGIEGAEDRHEWMLVELLDQMTRRKSGGEMGAFWRRDPLPQEDFIRSRSGREFDDYRKNLEKRPARMPSDVPPLPDVNTLFLQSGEVHRWMYDECSLRRRLTASGFVSVTRRAHDASFCPELLSYGLDAMPDGTVRKPDSLFMEAVKPLARTAVTKPRVAVFSTCDTGGAGIAAARLHRSFAGADIASQMYVAQQKTRAENLYVFPAERLNVVSGGNGSAVISGLYAAFQDSNEQTARYPHRPAGLESFSASAGCTDLGSLLCRQDFDIMNLHWTAHFLNHDTLHAVLRDRPLVWTLHDMRPFTGGCHYTAGCRRFTGQCGACPQLGSDDPRDLSFQIWRRSLAAFHKLNLHIVAPSEWLAEEARRSSLFRHFPVRVIRYAQPLDIFRPLHKKEIRQGLGLQNTELVLLFSAQSLKNTRKGVHFLRQCLTRLAEGPLRDKIHIMLMGDSPPDILLQTGLKTAAFGHVDDTEKVSAVYNAADAVLVTSLEDNSPNIVCEAAGCGVPVIAFAAGGIPEMIQHKKTGWLAPVGDVDFLVEGVRWLDTVRGDRTLPLRCRAFALEQWNPAARAAEYGELFREVLCRKKKEEQSDNRAGSAGVPALRKPATHDN